MSEPSRRRALLRTGSRLSLGLAMVIAGVLAIVIAAHAPLPQVRHSPAQTLVTPQAGAVTLVCPAPFRALGREAADAFAMQAAGEPRLALFGEPTLRNLVAPDVDAAGPAVLTAEAGAPFAGAESLSLGDDDLRGFAAAACRPARLTTWLVGGDTSLGASDVVTLANPGDVPSTVTLTVYAADAELSSTVIVPARTQLALPLAASIAGQNAPIVQVTATGAPVHAVLQSSLMRTLDPAGAALQDDAGAPDRRHVLAGVQVVAASGTDLLLRLRLMATAETAEASIRVLEGETVVAEQRVTLGARTPIEVGVEALTLGVYTVIVEATSPVVTAAWQATGEGADQDFAWMTPAPELIGASTFAVPLGPAPRLHLVNTQGQDATVTLSAGTPNSAEEQHLTIPAQGSVLVPLTAGTSYRLEAQAPVHAAVIFAGPRQIGGWPLWPEQGASAPILVSY